MESAANEQLQGLLASGLVRQEDWDLLPPWNRQRINDATDSKRLIDLLLTHRLLTGYQAARLRAHTAQWLILGDYRILDRLGAGSLGVVFKAEHRATRAVVAVKILVAASRRESSQLVRLLADCRNIDLVLHPNIVRTLDVGEARSSDPDCPVIYYFVMEYVDGMDVEQRVRGRGPLPAAEACSIAHQAASALAAAHRHQRMHGDLKPSNVLLTASGQAKLLDFGLARSLKSAHGNSQVDPSQPDFLAPEQADYLAPVDIRTDLWSLGALTFWCLTGKPPFPRAGDWRAALADRAKMRVPDLKTLCKDAPEGLQELLEKLLAYRPEDRPTSPDEVMAALARFLPGIAEEAPAPAPEAPVSGTPLAGSILIIDPDQACRAACRAALAEDGLTADEADTGKRGLASALPGSHDVIVLSADMTDLSGIEFLRYLRRNPPRPHQRLLVLCDHASPEAIGQMLSAGADDYLAKPVDPLQLRMRVKTALHLKQTQDKAAAEKRAAPTDEIPVQPAPEIQQRPGLFRALGRFFGQESPKRE